jgi:hypothetical protein
MKQSKSYKIQSQGYAKMGKSGLVILLVTLLGITAALSCCSEKPTPDPGSNLVITGVSIPSTIDALTGGNITITGKGFAINDKIRLTVNSDPSVIYVCNIISLTDQTATFTLPAGVTSGLYKISVTRGDDSLSLGSLTLNIVVSTDIPDIEGMTIKGVVYSDGVGVPGVVVSDGFEVTVTNSNGIYYLPSQKKHGYVFISLPGNYEVTYSNNSPQFFKRLTGGTGVEQRDFSLISSNNNNHVVIAAADWHLANRNDDLLQFGNWILSDMNSLISSYSAAGKKVYVLTLGDMTWEVYWHENNFSLPNYLLQTHRINAPVFNTMGNHDNDPYVANDWLAEGSYRQHVGPTYYSFNLGAVHYVVLDNIEYLNTGASQGVIGARNYNDVIVSSQLEWLKKDLATIQDKNTPLIIAMHIPLYRNPGLDGAGNQVNVINLANSSQFLTALQDFTNVHILSGHTHINFSVEHNNRLMEHNTAAVSATWWWTGKNGYSGNHICKDGSPGGLGIWEIEGTDLKWYYKSYGKPKNYQFRTYDLNQVHITAAKYAPNSTDAALAPYAGPYATANTGNEVLINVWGYDPQWEVKVSESGTPLTVTRVTALDPLHIISYEAKRLNAGAAPTSSFVTGNTSHMFKVTASGPTTTLEITVKDRFGNIYSETMIRPKAFSYLMN